MQDSPSASLTHFSKILDAHTYPNVHQEFHSGAVIKHYKSGETIVYQNEAIDKLGCLTNGDAEIEILSADGEMLIAERFFSGSLLNAVSFIDGQSSPATVVAVSDCSVAFVSYSKLRSSPALHTEATQLAGLCAAALYRMAEQLLSTSLLLPLKDRVLLRLQKLKQNDGEVTITAEKLAAYLAVSKHRVHRVLNELEKENRIINTYGSVTLL